MLQFLTNCARVNYGGVNIRMETIGFQILAVLLIVARGSIKVKNGVTINLTTVFAKES